MKTQNTQNTQNTQLAILDDDFKKTLKDDLFFASTTCEFKSGLFNKATTSKFMLNNDECKTIKNELKALKNIDFATAIDYTDTAKSVEKIKAYHLNIFIQNMLKFTKNDFDKILATFDDDKKLSFLRRVILDNSKSKNDSIKSQRTAVSGAKTLVRAFIIKVITEFNK